MIDRPSWMNSYIREIIISLFFTGNFVVVRNLLGNIKCHIATQEKEMVHSDSILSTKIHVDLKELKKEKIKIDLHI